MAAGSGRDHDFYQGKKQYIVELSIHSDEHYMREAYKQALLARDEGEIPVGAVVVADKRIIARAHNQTERLNDPTAHAEMLAVTAASHYFGTKYLNECALYVTLEPCVCVQEPCIGPNSGSSSMPLRMKRGDLPRSTPK